MYPDQTESSVPIEAIAETTTHVASSKTIRELMVQLELDPLPHDERFYHQSISAKIEAMRVDGEIPKEAVAEELAFLLHAHDHQDESSWGIYFGPLMSFSSESGETLDTPPLAAATPEILSYWRQRAGECTHPAMRARYADLLWELPKRLQIAKPDAEMARIAIDSYIESIESHRYEHSSLTLGKAKRALTISLSLSDANRIERSRDALVALEEEVAQDDSLGLWGFSFDILMDSQRSRIPLPDATRERIVASLEARLARFTSRRGEEYHPRGAEAAALRLAGYYRRVNRQADVVRVLRAYADVVKKMAVAASPMLAAHSLERLYDQITSFGLHDDAEALNEMIRVAGEESLKEMKETTTTIEISTEKLDSYFAALLDGTVEEVHNRLATEFVPKRDALKKQLQELATRAPLSYMISHSIKSEEGHTLAQIGPLHTDLDGQLLLHMSKNLALTVPWLREAMARGTQGGKLSAAALSQLVLASPLFPAKRHAIVKAGVNAYFEQDSIAAIHILVPQLEQGLRQLAILIGARIYSQRRGGGLQFRTLDDLLRDERIGDFLGDDVIAYLHVLLSDARGWNVRNNVCHGLSSTSGLSMPVADRVVHALLLLGLVRYDDS